MPPKKKKQLPRSEKDEQFHGRLSPENNDNVRKIMDTYNMSRVAAVNYLLKKGFRAAGEL